MFTHPAKLITCQSNTAFSLHISLLTPHVGKEITFNYIASLTHTNKNCYCEQISLISIIAKFAADRMKDLRLKTPSYVASILHFSQKHTILYCESGEGKLR